MEERPRSRQAHLARCDSGSEYKNMHWYTSRRVFGKDRLLCNHRDRYKLVVRQQQEIVTVAVMEEVELLPMVVEKEVVEPPQRHEGRTVDRRHTRSPFHTPRCGSMDRIASRSTCSCTHNSRRGRPCRCPGRWWP